MHFGVYVCVRVYVHVCVIVVELIVAFLCSPSDCLENSWQASHVKFVNLRQEYEIKLVIIK